MCFVRKAIHHGANFRHDNFANAYIDAGHARPRIRIACALLSGVERPGCPESEGMVSADAAAMGASLVSSLGGRSPEGSGPSGSSGPLGTPRRWAIS
jgi:hypothetical protein